MPYTSRSEEDMRRFIEEELHKQQTGLTFRFATIAKPSAQPGGSTSYLNIDRQHRRLDMQSRVGLRLRGLSGRGPRNGRLGG
jgi:hypothetical protein